jgi:hypothetical protein
MGVKVCPTALTPGVSFNSPQADPCPNNKLVAASTVLPINTYAVATSPAGIVVYQVNTSGVSEVTGSPFVPSPIPYNPESEQSAPAPMVTAVDPTGEYLYAVYNLGGVAGAVVYSFNMVSGVPHQLSNAGDFAACDSCDANPTEIIATAQHVYMQFDTSGAEFPSIQIISTKNGVLSLTPSIFLSGFANVTPNVAPISFAVDPQERFLYVYTSSTGGTVPDTTAIYSLNFTNSTATLVQVVSQSGQVLLGAQ